jgi:hypothetical protein
MARTAAGYAAPMSISASAVPRQRTERGLRDVRVFGSVARGDAARQPGGEMIIRAGQTHGRHRAELMSARGRHLAVCGQSLVNAVSAEHKCRCCTKKARRWVS